MSELALAGPVGLTTPAVHELLRRDIPVAWLSTGFWFLGTTGQQGPRSAAIRTAQYAAAADPARRLDFARSLVAAKLRNSRTILRRNWRGEAEARTVLMDRLTRVVQRLDQAASLDELLGLEGEGAALYFRAMPSLFSPEVAQWPEFQFERPGRPALALDLIEPYRSILADSAVLMALNNGEIEPGDFIYAAGGCALKPRARRSLIEAYERRLDQETTHPVLGYQLSMRRLIHVQARLFARWLLGEIPEYPHYVPR